MKARNTRQKELIEQAIDAQKGFFSAEDLYAQLQDSLGMATIYRNMKQLVKEQQLYMYTCDRRQVYSKTKQHCHVIEEKTGKVTHFEIHNLDFLKKHIKGNVKSIQIEVKI